jgi:hypothetical protein
MNQPDFLLHVSWYRNDDAPAEFGLGDVAQVEQLMSERDLWPYEISSDCPDLAVVLDHLSPIASPDIDELTVNGVTVVVADGLDGGHAFVPASNEPAVVVLASGSASWLPGGPCLFDQREELLRFGDLYWVDTSGDAAQQRIFAGRFTDQAAGLAALAEASIFFSFDAAGELVCELDSWPQEE